jgi:hypothetical protein
MPSSPGDLTFETQQRNRICSLKAWNSIHSQISSKSNPIYFHRGEVTFFLGKKQQTRSLSSLFANLVHTWQNANTDLLGTRERSKNPCNVPLLQKGQ